MNWREIEEFKELIRQKYGTISKVKLEVEGGSPIITGKFEVYFASDHNYQKVDIFWEETIKNYKDLGLYGYYSSKYYDMEYDRAQSRLIIVDDRNEPVIIYA